MLKNHIHLEVAFQVLSKVSDLTRSLQFSALIITPPCLHSLIKHLLVIDFLSKHKIQCLLKTLYFMNISRKHVLHKPGSDISKFHYKWIQHEDMRSRNKPQNTLNEVSLHQISSKAAIQLAKLTNSPLFFKQ